MSRDTISSLNAIHSMLAAGHRSICIRAHTLFLWGGAGGVLCLAVDHLITPERFPDAWQRNVALLLLLVLVLSTVGLADYAYTRRHLSARDESLSFVQAQITKVWWLLMGMGVLFTFATGMYGGGTMVFGVWLILVGIGLYVHGLFSDQVLEWAGTLVILLGIASLLLQIGYLPAKWLTASVLGLGMPALSLILGRKEQGGASKLVQVGLWLLWVVIPPMLGYYWFDRAVEPGGAAMPLSSFTQQSATSGERIVEIPAGTAIPLRLRMKSELLHVERQAELPMTLTQSLQIAVVDGKPDGRFKPKGQDWKRFPYDAHIWVEGFSAEVLPGRAPTIVVDLRADVKD